MSKRIVVAINPNASFGRRRKAGVQVADALRDAGHRVTALIEPDYRSLISAVSAAMTAGQDLLVVVGGDGMVNLGVRQVVNTEVPLGIVASGTGNDFARGLGLPIDDTDAAVTALLAAMEREPRVVDAGRVTHPDGTTSWFGGVLSAGFDAIVNERANRMRWPRGRSRYNLALLRELALLKPIRYRLDLDGEALETEAMLVAVANNTSLGGGMMITPDAELDDGLFDVLVVQPLSRAAFLAIFPRVFKGTHITDPRVSIRRAKRVRVDAAGIVAYADGERVSTLPIEVEVIPGSLRVLS